MTIALVSRIYCSVSHECLVFKTLCQVKRISTFTHSVIKVSSKTVDQSEDPEAGQAFVYSSKLAWKMFYLMAL